MKTLKIFTCVSLNVLMLCLVTRDLSATPGLDTDSNQPVAGQLRHTLTGDIRFHRNFHSKFLSTDRDIVVYLPPGYETNRTARYPVLYQQDGQNAFDSATSFFLGEERHLDEGAQELILSHKIKPLIIVGIYSTGLNRINEYTPTSLPCERKGGQADLYGRTLVEEIKPFIDSQYRTLRDRSNTALGGSSLGGLVTLYLGSKYVEVFSSLAIASPAADWDNEMIVRYLESHTPRRTLRVWLNVGTAESPNFLDSTRALRDVLVAKHWAKEKDFTYAELEGGLHNPDSWSKFAEPMLQHLFAKTRIHENPRTGR
ncbi:MAG: alpha/beta hydrolase-fold protein [Acidobacteriota bacterium]|nr:alpha/beta hydrolase-fold protein [Acidobacteriota bacterium]